MLTINIGRDVKFALKFLEILKDYDGMVSLGPKQASTSKG